MNENTNSRVFHNSVEIINKSSKSLPLDLEKHTLDLLKVVPDEHLTGLECIRLVDKVNKDLYINLHGMYKQKHKQTAAHILISVENIFNYEPYCLRFIPKFGKALLGMILFYEIGHHYRHLNHDLPVKDNKKFAERYRNKMMVKSFFWLACVLKPHKMIRDWWVRRGASPRSFKESMFGKAPQDKVIEETEK